MSLILDALRKSETERRRGEAPGLFTPLPTPGARRVARGSNGPMWIAAAILVLVAIAAVAGWYRKPAPDRPAPDMPAPVVMTPTPAPSIVPAAAPTPIAPPAPLVVAPQPRPTPASAMTQAFENKPRAEPRTEPSPPAPPLAVPPIAEPPLPTLPTLATLDPAERAALPPLKLSMHVWSEAPNARLAIIDGQRVMEGSDLGGSIVVEIRRDGVVLDIHGRRFLLPRP